jgi:threonine/homoserine/homoserine lactone efflux protein
MTPGPTNTLLASSGVQVGIRRSLALIPAVALGYVLAISIWGLLIGRLSAVAAWLPSLLKLLSAAYMVYLSCRLWRSAQQSSQGLQQAAVSPPILLLTTLLNPKALLFASAVFPVGVWQHASMWFAHMSVFLALILPIALLWMTVGALLIKRPTAWLNQVTLQRTASVVLFGFSIPLSLSVIS